MRETLAESQGQFHMGRESSISEIKHGSPVVERTAEILGAVASNRKGIGLADLVTQLSVPRSTAYRILNSLAAHGLIARADGGSRFVLGPRFIELARTLSPSTGRAALIEAAMPVLRSRAERVGETFKLSARDGDEMLTLLSVPSGRDYSLAVKVGSRSPMHVGAAGKVTLAHAGDDAVAAYCAKPLEARTPHTITDPDVLRDELSRIRRDGYAEDLQESGPGIRAYAAPVWAEDGVLAAAVSAPFIGEPAAERRHRILRGVLEAAEEVTVSIGGIVVSPLN